MKTPDFPTFSDSYLTESLTEEDTVLQPEIPRKPSTALQRLCSNLWEAFLHWAATCHEPKIRQRFDRQGRSSGWQVFDPHTGRTSFLGSELEVRQWLEERYR
jgi:hypothetical protein